MKSLNLDNPYLIVMVGIPGSGKSFFAENFSNTLKAPLISFDRLRKELSKIPIQNTKEEETIKRVSAYMLDESLKTSKTIIYDGAADTLFERDLLNKKAQKMGYNPLFVWVQTEIMTAKKRAVKPTDNKISMNSEQYESKLKRFNVPNRTEKTIVISGKHTYTSQLKIVLNNLTEIPQQKDTTIQVITNNRTIS